MKKIFLAFLKHYLTILGFIIICLYFWNRFFKLRTPKDLPLKLTIPSFFILVYICCIFAFILITLLFPRKSNKNLEIIMDWFFTPIKHLEIFIRNISFVKSRYRNYLQFIRPILEYIIIRTNLFFIIFWVIPRLFLLTALLIDIFIFHKFYFKYQVVLFGLLLFFNRYFKYFLRNIKEELIKDLSPDVDHVTTDYCPGIHPSELQPDYDLNDEDNTEWYETMCLPLEIFIKYQTESIVYSNINRYYHLFNSLKLKEKFWEDIVGEPYVFYYAYKPVPKDYKNKFGDKSPANYNIAYDVVFEKIKEYLDTKYHEILYISLLIEYLNKTSNYDSKIKYLKILIFLNYLLCWLYILVISLPSLNIGELFTILNATWKETTEPFSEIATLEIENVNNY